MIQWIALAMAADAEVQAARAKDMAGNANRNASSGSTMVIIRPVDVVTKRRPDAKGFWAFLELWEVLDDKPWATLSIKKSDILNLSEHSDEAGRPFVRLQISEYAKVYRGDSNIIGLYVPGTIEEVTAVLAGA